MGLEKLHQAEPGGEVVGPDVSGDAGAAEAEAVFAGGVDVDGGGALGLAPGGVERDGVADGEGIVVGGQEDHGRGVGGDGQIGRDDGVDGDDEGGARGGVEAHGDVGGEITAGGEAHDAEAVRMEPELLGAGAEETQGLADVFKRLRDDGVAGGVGAGAVLEDKGRDAQGIEPAGDIVTLFLDGEMAKAAAGGDEDGGAVGLGGGVDREEGVGDLADAAFGVVGADEGLRLVGAVGPEGDELGEGDGHQE